MQTDDVNQETMSATVAEFAPAQAVPIEAQPEAPAAEAAKSCCICGLDVSNQTRSRDKHGRYWCKFCHEFIPSDALGIGMAACPDCGRPTRVSVMVDQSGIKVCHACNQSFDAERHPRRQHKLAVTANPEMEIRKTIRQFAHAILGLTAVAALVTLYHFGWLYLRPRSWVPFESALYTLGSLVVLLIASIVVQYIRIGIRRRLRQSQYDDLIRSAIDRILTSEDDSHALGINESSAPLRRRVERGVWRTEAYAGSGNGVAAEVLEVLTKKGNVEPLIEFLLSHRPECPDLVARNREVATLCYLHKDYPTASSAVTAILLRMHHDQEAMTRHALINFRIGELEFAKKIFKRVINTAREKNSELDLADAFCNLGMLHMMLSEFDDAQVRYSQAMAIFKKLGKEQGQAECMLRLGLIAYRQKKKGAEALEAEQQFRHAMAINRKHRQIDGLSICCSLLGVILIEKNPPQLREAEKLLNHALKLNMELGRPGGVAAAYGNLGLVRIKRRDYSGARDMLLKAQNIYLRVNRKMVLRIQEMMKTVDSMSGARR